MQIIITRRHWWGGQYIQMLYFPENKDGYISKRGRATTEKYVKELKGVKIPEDRRQKAPQVGGR